MIQNIFFKRDRTLQAVTQQPTVEPWMFAPIRDNLAICSSEGKGIQKSGDPVGTRTLDPLIKSQLLYQLSYRVNF